MFTVAGDQVPEIEFVEVLGKVGAILPVQIKSLIEKVGVVDAVNVMDVIAVSRHVLGLFVIKVTE